MKKEQLNALQLCNMSVGFLGIQFGWGLQMANISAIFERLGAHAHELPMLWFAAPFTGLVIQPIIGNMSDRTWGFLGRRRPYFLMGAILAAIALVLMPHSSTLWMAAGLLWLLDTSANITMVPFRAFVGDLLPKEQRTQGFAVQGLFIGLGSVLASLFPWVLHHVFGVSNLNSNEQKIPLTVELSFYVGAALFLGTILWTVVTTKEYPPPDLAEFKQKQMQRSGLLGSFREIWGALQEMPLMMKQLAWVQWFTWLGLDCFFLYFPPAIAHNIFGATDQDSSAYTIGIEWAGICIATYNAVGIIISFMLPRLAQVISIKLTHSICLLCGAAGLLSLAKITNQYLLLVPMVGIGLVWASVLAMPYALLMSSLPLEQSGIYMGIFNFFVVLPQICVSVGFGWVMENILHNNRLLAIVVGGGFLMVAALLMPRVQEVGSDEETSNVELSAETAVK
ncbi:MAG TPA: MFS transporter [Waterburya sp.]|jgi:maltose/moltooligosaccharide transporter